MASDPPTHTRSRSARAAYASVKLRGVLALTIGSLTGVLLATLPSVLGSGNFFGGAFERARLAAAVAFLFAIPIAIASAVIWQFLSVRGRDGPVCAVVLGISLVAITLFVDSYGAGQPSWEILRFTAPYASCGGVAGGVTWFVEKYLAGKR